MCVTVFKGGVAHPGASPGSPADFDFALGRDVVTTANRILQRDTLSQPVVARDFQKNPITPAERRERARLYSAQLRTKRKFVIEP